MYIYKLIDPADDTVFYIGQTNDTKARLYGHITAAQNRTASEVFSERVCRILASGNKPRIEIIEIVEKSLVDQRERDWIEFYKEKNIPLCNSVFYKPKCRKKTASKPGTSIRLSEEAATALESIVEHLQAQSVAAKVTPNSAINYLIIEYAKSLK